MNLSYFISKRISGRESDGFSGTIHKIAVASISIGLATMIISFLILKGFQENIEKKIVSFSGHLQVTKFTLSNSYEEDPISIRLPLLHDYSEYPYIDHIQEYASKPGLLKANDEHEGVVMKGVAPSFNVVNFSPNIIKGRFPNISSDSLANEIIISSKIADLLSLDVGDSPLMYFIQNPPRVRKLEICGIYETGMEDFDEKLILGDIRLVQRINNWPDTLVGGMEIYLDLNTIKLKDRMKIWLFYNHQIEEASSSNFLQYAFGSVFNFFDFVVFLDKIETLPYFQYQLEDVVGYELYIEQVSDKYAEIFDWLALLNRNVVIFLSLILFVASFNMVSILIILIMERTQMIGALKAFGASNNTIRKIFLYNGMLLIAKGLVIGNAIGLIFGFIQSRYHIIPLDAKSYYMEFVPISWDWGIILSLNILTFIIVSLTLYIPTRIIASISPIKAIRFD